MSVAQGIKSCTPAALIRGGSVASGSHARSAVPRRMLRTSAFQRTVDVHGYASRRTYASDATSPATKPTIANIAEVRKQLPGTSMIKAREALAASNNDVAAALTWLDKDMQASGAKKASKVGDRIAKEGGIGVCILSDGVPAAKAEQHVPSGMQVEGIALGARAGIVELNCETDFVGRNEIFQGLLRDIAHTAALFPTLAMDEQSTIPDASSSPSHGSQGLINIPVAQLLDFPLLPHVDAQAEAASPVASAVPKTVGAAIIDVVSRLGERIHLARASALSSTSIPSPSAPRRSATAAPRAPWHVASAFTHGGPKVPAAASGTAAAAAPGTFASSGRVGSLLLTRVSRGAHASRDPSGESEGQIAAQLVALRGLTRSLARQAAGMPTRSIRASTDAAAEVADGDGDAAEALYHQPFMMRLAAAELPGFPSAALSTEDPVETVLRSWGQAWMALTSDETDIATASSTESSHEPIEVISLRRWQLGEPLEA